MKWRMYRSPKPGHPESAPIAADNETSNARLRRAGWIVVREWDDGTGQTAPEPEPEKKPTRKRTTRRKRTATGSKAE